MQLYIDDALTDESLDAEALDRALMLFRPMGHKRLAVRRDACRQLTLSRWDEECFIEVETPGRVEGVLAADWSEACDAARDYFAGRAAKARLPSLLRKGAAAAGEIFDLIIGEVDDNCPLCRAMKQREANS